MRQQTPPHAPHWVDGNQCTLLENGQAYLPRVLHAIAQARREVFIEAFAWSSDPVGRQLHAALCEAALRGLQVHVLLDGHGARDLPPPFLDKLAQAGGQVRFFGNPAAAVNQQPPALERMHRQLAVIDGEIAFLGGVDHGTAPWAEGSAEGDQNYAVQVQGPLVHQIEQFVRAAAGDSSAPHDGPPQAPAGTAKALWLARSRARSTKPHSIERHYCLAVRKARQRVVIAHASFFPSYRLVREMRRAAQRGVEVRLIVQGHPDLPGPRTAASCLHDHLQRNGVWVYEYCDRPLYGKAALVDDDWSTLGTSQIDPLSLSLHLTADVIIQDRSFNRQLHDRLAHLMANSYKKMTVRPASRWEGLRRARSYGLCQLMRWFPTWERWQPYRQSLDAEEGQAQPPTDPAASAPAHRSRSSV